MKITSPDTGGATWSTGYHGPPRVVGDAPDVQRSSKPPMKYRAPSWSWASDGGIESTDLTPFDPAKVGLNNILDRHVMPLRENPFWTR